MRVAAALQKMGIRQAVESDFVAMWPIFQAVIAPGTTYVFAEETSYHEHLHTGLRQGLLHMWPKMMASHRNVQVCCQSARPWIACCQCLFHGKPELQWQRCGKRDGTALPA